MSRRSARKPIPEQPGEGRIESLSHDGRGIAHVNGKTVFVSGALPGERVRFRYRHSKSRYDDAEVLEVLEASPQRVAPRCAHFGVCGGCSLQHMQAEAQLELKQASLLEQLQHLGGVTPREVLPPLAGPAWGYRRRARMGVKYVEKKQSLLVGFREKASGFLAELNACEVMHPSVGRRIAELREVLGKLAAIRQIVQLEVAVGDNVTNMVLRNLAALDAADLQILREFAQASGIQLYLQPGGVDSLMPLWPELPQALYYDLPEDGLRVQFEPLDFVQVNGGMNQLMVRQAMALLDVRPDQKVLELFCGLGNFTLPLARRARRVVAVEGDMGLLRRAGENAERNGLDNMDYILADLTQVAADADWLGAAYQKVLLDPPRSGALEVIRQLKFKDTRRIVYISCNPATLARDAGELAQRGFRLQQAGIMDMFPHTAHVESVAVFEAE